jgi:exo-beta-1,3-glucanase (GH17 family)
MLGVKQNLYDTYKDCIVQQVENYPGTVVGVAIGNESVQDNNWNIGDIIIAHAQDLRKTLADKNIVVPVGTVQQSGFGLCSFANICTPLCPQSCKDIYRKMLANLDFIAFNVYPSTPTGGPAIASNDATFNKNSTYSQFDSLFRYVFQGKLWIGECGMPHEGSCKAGNGDVQTFTRTLQSTLVQDIKMWSSTHTKVPLYIFMAFDVPSKPDTPACAPLPSGEKTFGVLQNQECPRISL